MFKLLEVYDNEQLAKAQIKDLEKTGLYVDHKGITLSFGGRFRTTIVAKSWLERGDALLSGLEFDKIVTYKEVVVEDIEAFLKDL